MTTTTRAAGDAPGRRLRPLAATVVALTTLLALVGLGAPSASAASYAGGYWSPGHVWTAPISGRGHITSSGAVKPGLRFPSMTVSRSPATSGQQTVQYDHHVYEWVSGAWRQRGVQPGAVVVPAGYGSNRTFAHLYQLPQLGDSVNGYGTGYWYVVTNFRWYDAASGRQLGGRTVDFNSSADYACEASRYVFCQVGPGWVRVI